MADGVTSSTLLLQVDPNDLTASATESTPLPAPRALVGLALWGNSLVVAGGASDVDMRTPRANVWALAVRDGGPAGGWKALPPLPDTGRILPRLVVQGDGSKPCLYVLGGLAGNGESILPAKLASASDGWRALPSPPKSISPLTHAIPIGPAHIFFWPADAGALAPERLRPRETGAAPSTRAFHTITETWTSQPNDLVPVSVANTATGVQIVALDEHGMLRFSTGKLQKSERRLHWIDYIVVASYFGAVMLIGLWFSRGKRSTQEYYRGENQIPAYAAGLSLMATKLSAVTLIALPAKVYATNWTYFLFPLGNFAVAWVLTRYVIPFYCRLNLTSIYEYLEARFSRSIRLLGSLAFLILETARLGVLLLVPALVVSVIVDINIYACVACIGLATTVATVFGGIKGVIWADVLQAVLIFAGALVCIGVVVFRLDGIGALLSDAGARGKLTVVEWSTDLTRATIVIIVLSWIGEIKNYVANQTLAQRFIVTRDEKSAARAVWINACAIVPAIALCMVVGTALFLFYSVHPEQLNPAMGKPDELLPTFILHELPPGLAGIAVAAIVAASMSNSVLNSMSAVVVSDLYRPLFPQRDDRAAVRFGARFIWVVGIFGTGVALLLAQYRVESLFDQLMELLGLFGGGLGGIFLLGIFTTRGNTVGAWTGLVVSCAVLAYVKFYTPVHVFAYLAIGMMTCFGVGYGVSALIGRKQKNLSGLTVHTRAAAVATG